MLPNEKVAHDLAMVYMNQRYSVTIEGKIYGRDGDVDGEIKTLRYPSTTQPNYVKVKTGEKGFLGREKTEKVQSGMAIDSVFVEMTKEYLYAYNYFYQLLCGINKEDE